MSHAWFSRTTTASHAWADLGAGVINGDATVLDSVERDMVMVWQQHASVEADLALLWQVNADPITAVESELALTWNVITEAGSYVESDLELLWQRAGSVTASLNLLWQVGQTVDVAGTAEVRRVLKHPGWQRKQAMDQLQRERAMDRNIRVALKGEPVKRTPALRVATPPKRSTAQMAAAMASAQASVDPVAVARRRAVEAGIDAQRARVEIQRLQPELAARRQQASYRVIEQLLRGL